MKHTTLISALTAAASLAALPTLASADHRRMTPQLVKLGDVGTHAGDAEDFVPVAAQRFDALVIVARDGVVPLSGLKVQYTDGKIDEPFARGFLRPGQRIVVDVPEGKPIKMLVIDYDERKSSRLGDRATARVEVYGQSTPAYVPDWKYRRDRQAPGRVQVRVQQPRFEWRGGVYLRVN